MSIQAAEIDNEDPVSLVVTSRSKREVLERFELALSQMADPRRKQGLRYPLRSVVVIALLAMVCGADDAQALQTWGEANEAWLLGFLDLPHGIPSQDVFLAVFASLSPTEFSGVFMSWMELLREAALQQGRHIAVDGKTSRRSFDKGSGKVAIHTVSAFLSSEGCVLGQVKTQAKSNEITAIPELLRLLELKGATVTIDAMGCQTEIASMISERGGHYLLSVKDNQPTLHQELKETFLEADDARRRSIDEEPRPAVETFSSVEKSHGRLEERTVRATRALSWISEPGRWAQLAVLIQVVSTRTDLSTGKSSTETRYYIGNDRTATAEQLGHFIRRHWSIENELHWVLDMAFHEDQARHRAGNCAHNFTTLRHFALNLIKQERTSKLGVANKRKRAGWDLNYLFLILTGTPST